MGDKTQIYIDEDTGEAYYDGGAGSWVALISPAGFLLRDDGTPTTQEIKSNEYIQILGDNGISVVWTDVVGGTAGETGDPYEMTIGIGADTIEMNINTGLRTTDTDNIIRWISGVVVVGNGNIGTRIDSSAYVDFNACEPTLDNAKAIIGYEADGTTKQDLVQVNALDNVILGTNASDSTVMASSTVVHTVITGTIEFSVSATDVTIPTNNLEVTDGRLTVNESADSNTVVIDNTNASFGNHLVVLETTRTGSSAFNFITARSNNGGDNEWYVRGDGEVYADGNFNSGGADFAEWMEWEDGNPDEEDRRGISVVIVPNFEEKPLIREALEGEDPVGVTSPNATVVGNSDGGRYYRKYKRDQHGKYRTRKVRNIGWTNYVPREPDVNIAINNRISIANKRLSDLQGDEGVESLLEIHRLEAWKKGAESELIPEEKWGIKEEPEFYPIDSVPEGVIPPPDAKVWVGEEKQLSDTYDPNADYVPRDQRKEWAAVGITGIVFIREGQVVGDRWRRLSSSPSGPSKWLIR